MAALPAADDDRARLLELINANWTTQAIGVAVALDLPRLLSASPHAANRSPSPRVATNRRCGACCSALASLGLCAQRDDGCFELTPLGALLDPEAPQSLHAWARLRAVQWPALG